MVAIIICLYFNFNNAYKRDFNKSDTIIAQDGIAIYDRSLNGRIEFRQISNNETATLYLSNMSDRAICLVERDFDVKLGPVGIFDLTDNELPMNVYAEPTPERRAGEILSDSYYILPKKFSMEIEIDLTNWQLDFEKYKYYQKIVYFFCDEILSDRINRKNYHPVRRYSEVYGVLDLTGSVKGQR